MLEPPQIEVLARIASGDVVCVVVGMVAGIIGGVPLTTEDVDIVPLQTPDNVERLLAVLRDIEAVPRLGGSLDGCDLLGPADHGFDTSCGPLDVYATIERGKSYADLVALSRGVTHIEDCFGDVARDDRYEHLRPLFPEPSSEHTPLRVLALEALYDMKRRSARPKDAIDLEYIGLSLDERPAVVHFVPKD